MGVGDERGGSGEEEGDPVRDADGEDGRGPEEGNGWVGVIEICDIGGLGTDFLSDRDWILLSWSIVVMIQQILLSQLDALHHPRSVQ